MRTRTLLDDLLTILLVGIAFWLGFTSCHGAELAKLSNRDAAALLTALRNLDGHMVVTKGQQGEGTVMVPWEFGSGTLRLKIASDIAILNAVDAQLNTARTGIIKELLAKYNVAKLEPGSPESDAFFAQFNEVLDQPAPGSQDLARIKASELKLDKNEIPVTVLAALKPILEMDQ